MVRAISVGRGSGSARSLEGIMGMRGRGARRIGGLLTLLVLAATVGGALAQDGGGSPAGGHAQVIAHGVIGMPADELTWRLYDGEAGPLDDAEPFAGDWPGFLLGGDDPILVDIDGDRSVVSDGTATLVREGADLTVASLDETETGYGWLTLTDAGLDEDDALLLLSDPFDAPSGDRRVDLVRDVLAEDEETDIAAGAAPTVLLVVEGEVSVAVDGPGGESERLEAGEGFVADGLLTVRAREDDSVILAAVIGDRVPSGSSTGRRTPTPAQTGDEAVGAIEFYVQSCAPGIGVEDIADDVCPFTEPTDGDLQLLTFEGTEQLGPLEFSDAEVGQTGYVWTNLEFGTHVLQVFASEPESVYVEETDQVVFIPGPQYEITLTEEEPSALVPIYRLTEEIPEEEVGTVTVTFLGCEPGQDPEFYLPENCYEPIEGSTALSGQGTGLELGPDDAVVNDDGSLTWTILGYDTFSVVELEYPAGYDGLALSENPVATSADAPDAYVYVYCFLPLDEEFVEEESPEEEAPEE